MEDFDEINAELKKYSEELASRPMIVAANKCDIAEEESVARLEEYVRAQGMEFYRISAAAHMGVKELVDTIAEHLAQLPPIAVYEPEYIEPEADLGEGEPEIENDDGYWTVDGGWVDRLVQNTNFGDYESRMHFDRVMRTRGLFDKLEELGINEGDTVNVCGLEFEYRR